MKAEKPLEAMGGEQTEARHHLDSATLIARWKNLPHGDPAECRADVDQCLDPSL